MSNSRVPAPYPDVKQVNDERWVPPLPDAQKPVSKETPLCVACNRYHGSVNEELNCLRATVVECRKQMALVGAEETVKRLKKLDYIESLGPSVRAIPTSKGGKYEEFNQGKRNPSGFAQG